MTDQQFEKSLTANDTGHSGAHQAGIHIPKSQTDLIAFLPPLDPSEKNPSAWLDATDEAGRTWRLRYIHYNNRLHDPDGTRDEYRITHLTVCLRAAAARPGDRLIISGDPGTGRIRLRVEPATKEDLSPRTIRLKGWRRVH